MQNKEIKRKQSGNEKEETKMAMKAINAVWLAKTDLTNLNSGIGGSNLVDVKKYKDGGKDYPYASGQAMRYYWKEAIRREIETENYCVANDKGETCGDIEKCFLCDLFGFMTTIKKGATGGGAKTRISPIKMSPAMGLFPLQDNLTIDFLTRRKRGEEAGELKGDIVNVELTVNLYKAGFSIDVVKIGGEEKIDLKERKSKGIEYCLKKENERKERIKLALETFKHISDFSKQARLLTDFSPDIILLSIQETYNHLIQKALELKTENGKRINDVDTIRLNEVLSSLEKAKFYAGVLSGTFANQEEIKDVLKKYKIEVVTPTKAIDNVIAQI